MISNIGAKAVAVVDVDLVVLVGVVVVALVVEQAAVRTPTSKPNHQPGLEPRTRCA